MGDTLIQVKNESLPEQKLIYKSEFIQIPANPKIVFLQPPFMLMGGGVKGSSGKVVPLALLYLAGALRDKVKCEIKIMDAETENYNYDDVSKHLLEEKPDIICMACLTPGMSIVKKIVERARKELPNTILFAGGIHPTAFPENTITNFDFDIAAFGEAEETICEVVQALKDGKSLHEIKGITYKQKQGVQKTELRPLIQDLDSIPFPARDLIDSSKYYSTPTKKVTSAKNTFHIMTSRGCIYDCIYCISKSIWRRKVRFRSAKNVVDEIEYLVNTFGAEEFNFVDDLFSLNTKRIEEIRDEIVKRNIKIGFVCCIRTDCVNPKMLKAMKEAGCVTVTTGIESGNSEILKNIRKQLSFEKLYSGVKMIKEAGLGIHSGFLIGSPGETEQSIKDTIKLAKSLDLDEATFFITSPYPGTDLYDLAKDKGFIQDVNWENFAPFSDKMPIIVQEGLSAKTLIKWQKRAYREFYLRPKYVWRKLKRIKSFNDIKHLVTGMSIFMAMMKKEEVQASS